MYETVKIRNFRGIGKLDVDDLTRINVLLGKNNAGKTSVLEAVFLLCGGTNPSVPNAIAAYRGQRTMNVLPDNVWRPLFHQMDPNTPIRILGRWKGDSIDRQLQIEATLQGANPEVEAGTGIGTAIYDDELTIEMLTLNYTDANQREYRTQAKYDAQRRGLDVLPMDREDFVRCQFLSARSYPAMDRDARQFSHLVRIKQQHEIEEALRIIEPRVQRVELLAEYGGSAIYVDLGLPSLIPLAACGEGFVRFFSIIVEITSCRQGVLLIDEIDNGLHYSVMKKLWKLLGRLSEKHDVQIIATTHNEELITSAVEALSDQLDSLAVYRIDRFNTGHNAVRYDAETLPAVCDAHFEIRG